MFKYFAHILTFRYSDSLFSDLHDGSDVVFRLDRPDGQVASFPEPGGKKIVMKYDIFSK